MRLVWRVAAVAGLMLGTTSWAQDVGAPAPATPPGTAAGALNLSIRARTLGLVPEPPAVNMLGLEPVKAPTGEGTTRMPAAATGREKGVYIGVVVCDPDGVERLYMVRGDDKGSLPEGPIRTGAPGPSGLYLPGRPIP